MKKTRWIILLIFAFIIGFLFSFLVYNGYWYRFINGIKTLAWYEYILLIILTFLITLTVHELGHLFSMVFQGVRIRALYLYMVMFYKTKKGWRIKLKPRFWYLVGGFVVPDLGIIKDDESYQKLVTRFANSLKAGPIVTIAFLGLTNLMFLLSIAFNWNSNLIGILSLLNFYTIILSSLYIKSFKLSNASFYGDFIAYKKMKEDKLFQIIEINQYRSFSLVESNETDQYLFNLTQKMMKESELKTTLFYQMLIISYIEGVCYHNYKDDEEIKAKLLRYPLGSHFRNEQGITLLYELALYFYHLGLVEKSYKLIEDIKKKANPKIDEKMRIYLEKKYTHILHIEDYEDYLNTEKNYSFGLAGLFEDLIDMDEMTKEMHAKRPFQPWFTEVHMIQEEENKRSDSN